MRNGARLALAIALITSTSCGGNGTTTPTNLSSSGSNSCRTYATASTTLTTTNTGASNTRNLNCTYSTGANQLNCSMTLSACGTVTFSVNYASTSDFVKEVSVIPPRMLQQSQTTATNGCNIGNGTYTYDSQKRLVQYTINGLTYAYSAWDANGRPTVGSVSGGIAESWTYNDANRTATLVQSTGGGATTTVYTYDTNGNPVSVVVAAGGSVSTSTTNTITTAQVCG